MSHWLRFGVCMFLSTVLAFFALGQQQENRPPGNSSLVKLLQSKGILSQDEAASLLSSSSQPSSNLLLAELLLKKGLITREEYERTFFAADSSESPPSSAPQMVPAVLRMPSPSAHAVGPATQATAKSPEVKFVPAIAPMRVLPITVPKKDGLLPDIKLGNGAKLQPYGFFKASVVSQTTSSGGPIWQQRLSSRTASAGRHGSYR